MKRPNPSIRSAFTLVEMLLVIVIIGMLVALVSVAAVRAIGTAHNAQITVEIGLLDSAMQAYKNEAGGAFPPDCTLLSTPASGSPTTQDTRNRQNRILAHLRKAFPRLIVPAGYGPASQPGTLQYMSQNAFSSSQLYGPGGSGLFNGANTPNGVSIWGDIDNLDPAEAMVFWLGGFPIPYKDSTGKWQFKLIGFSANKVGNAISSTANASGANAGFGPFNLDVSSRDLGPFEFSQGRLGDADGDGWPEYYPPVGEVPQPPTSAISVANPTPPYVYFDAVSYGYYTTPTLDIGQATWSPATNPPIYPLSAVYPSSSSTGAQPKTFPQWGVAMPYAQIVPSSGSASITWVNPQKFQIISAGLDQMYWYWPLPLPAGVVNNLLRIYPAGTNYSQGDLDNLTNFSNSTLQSAQP